MYLEPGDYCDYIGLMVVYDSKLWVSSEHVHTFLEFTGFKSTKFVEARCDIFWSSQDLISSKIA